MAHMADTAMRLGHFFGTTAQFWMNLQVRYDLSVAGERLAPTLAALPTLKDLSAHT